MIIIQICGFNLLYFLSHDAYLNVNLRLEPLCIWQAHPQQGAPRLKEHLAMAWTDFDHLWNIGPLSAGLI